MIKEHVKIDSSHSAIHLMMQSETEMQSWQRTFPHPQPATYIIGHQWEGMKLVIAPEAKKEAAIKSLQIAVDEVNRLKGCLKQMSLVNLQEHPSAVATLKEMARQSLLGAKPMPGVQDIEPDEATTCESQALAGELAQMVGKGDKKSLLTRAAELGIPNLDRKLSAAQMAAAILEQQKQLQPA